MSNVTWEDPEDWFPEDDGVGSDSLTIEALDDRWIDFYTSRFIATLEDILNEDDEPEE